MFARSAAIRPRTRICRNARSILRRKKGLRLSVKFSLLRRFEGRGFGCRLFGVKYGTRNVSTEEKIMLPPIPSWDGLHPIIVHFPIALLLIAPILIVLGTIFYKNGRAFMVSAFVLMLIGTIAAFIATATGEAAGELAER